jgi:hypothetical protein
MFYTNRTRMQNRKAIVFGCSIGLLLTAFGSSALAGDNTTPYTPVAEGSTPSHRTEIDSWNGQVFIYVGGSLPTGTNLVAFQFLFDTAQVGGTTTGYITPLLFEYSPVELYTVYTVVGIGKGFDVSLNSLPQAIPFEIIEGIKAPIGANFTFGFVNALVNSSGVPTAASLGTVDMVSPANGGQGVGGTGTTNDWVCSGLTESQGPDIPLGTTFGVSGADHGFALPYRTYSARAIGVLAAQ